MTMPVKPPIDDFLNLSIADVEGCVWFVWKKHFKETAYPLPTDLMAVEISKAFPPKPWGVGSDPDGVAKKFLKDIQNVLEAYTLHRANVGFAAFAKMFDKDETWGKLAALFHSKAVYVAGLRRAKALKALQ